MGVGGSNARTVAFWMYVMPGQQSESGMYGYGTRSCTDGRNNIGHYDHSGEVPTILDSVLSIGAGIRRCQ